MSSTGRDNPTKYCDHPCDKIVESSGLIIPHKRNSPFRNREYHSISVQDFLGLLKEIPESEFTSDHVADFLKRHPVELESLSPYTFFSQGRYTRNLVFTNERFEVMVLCWDTGRATPIHNHNGQSCWVHVLSGQLSFTNYKWLGCDRVNRNVHLQESSKIPLAPTGSLSVIDERDTIHALSNDSSFNERAISLHIYARPLSTCVIYDMKNDQCFDKPLSYFSIEGKII